MDDTHDLDPAICAIARALYRMDVAQLAHAEEDLERLLRLVRHYQQVAAGHDCTARASHLQVGPNTLVQRHPNVA